MKKKSLAFQLALVMVIIVTGTFLICWLVNKNYLEDYYLFMKQKEMSSAYNTIRESYNNGVDEDFIDKLLEKSQARNVNILVKRGETLICASSFDADRLLGIISEALNGKGRVQGLSSGDNYKIIRVMERENEYLILTGKFSDDSDIYVSTPLESIRESAKISNSFLLWISIGAAVFSSIIIFLMAKRMSKPIRQLSDISNRMAGLDFEAKYFSSPFSSREIDELGNDMNEMSNTLERTISELKVANLSLMEDIHRKEEIDEMRKEFISNVSHELKTPLALIQGYAEGLKEGVSDDPESCDFYCEVIMDEANKMNKMVGKLLTLNQLEFGNEALEFTRFDITELIQGVITASALIIKQKEVTVNFENNGPEFVWGDEFKIEEVITNYLSNALNHIGGTKNIRIRYEVFENHLRVCVYNTGEQIPVDELDKVWIKFYKVDKARTREYGGNGIGLSIVKAIMDAHHQQCGVQNYDDGVEFWMELDRNI